jgi:molecular chaperone HscB
MPTSFSIDIEELERSYLRWSRELHPDFFQLRSADEQQQSLVLSAALNDAYATLKDPLRRADYLVQLHGGPSASECRDMPDGFFEQVLDLRMEIEELREENLQHSKQGLALRRNLEGERQEALDDVAKLFGKMEGEGTLGHHAELAAIRMQLNKIKYLDGLLRDLKAP